MQTRVLFATFSVWLHGKRTPINGMVEPMLRYFQDKNIPVDLIDGMHPGSSDVVTLFEQHDKTTHVTTSLISKLLQPILRHYNTNQTQILFKVRDALVIFEWAIRARRRYDLFIGLESIYTAAGIILKKLGVIQTVVYYVSDYAPQRYGSSLFNKLYLALDRFCCYHSDFIWDVSLAFHPARIQAGLIAQRSAPVIHVPNALFPEQVCPAPKKTLIPFSLVFAGTLNIYNGPDLAVQAMAGVIRKYPNATLHIYGTNGKDQARVTTLMQQLGITQSVVFHGLITDAIELSRTINHYMIGLAPYIERNDSHRAFGDATKLRLYAGAGLPIVTTHVPPLGKELAKLGAAMISDDNPDALAQSIVRILASPTLHSSMRTKAIHFAKNNIWEQTYSDAFEKMSTPILRRFATRRVVKTA